MRFNQSLTHCSKFLASPCTNKLIDDQCTKKMLFRPVYLRTPPLKIEPPPPKKVKKKIAPKPKEPTPPPTPIPPEPEIEEVKEEVVEQVPVLMCGKGLTAVYPEEATEDVLNGNVDYYLVDDRGVTLVKAKEVAKKGHERILDRQFLGLEKNKRKRMMGSCYGGDYYGADLLWTGPTRRRAMSSGNLRRGYTGPRA